MASKDRLSSSSPSNDHLSLTSSSDETHSQDEWTVRRILAEAKVQGEIKYLIDWDGFELCDATWEPANHLSDELLADWLATKKKTGQSAVQGFKISTWRQAVNDDLRVRYAEHVKKNQERERLGLEQSDPNCTLEDWINTVPGPSEDGEANQNDQKALESPKSLTRTKSPAPLPDKLQMPELQQNTLPTLQMHKGREINHEAIKIPADKADNPKTKWNIAALMSNVLIGGKKRRARPNLLDTTSNTRQPPRLLNHHKRRLIEKGLRDMEGTRTPGQAGQSHTELAPPQITALPVQKPSNCPQARGILLPQGSFVHPRATSYASRRKRVHWEDDSPFEKTQVPSELNDLLVGKVTTPNVREPKSCKERESTQPDSEELAPTIPEVSVSGTRTSRVSKVCQFGNHAGLSATLEFAALDLDSEPPWYRYFQSQSRWVFSHMCTIQDLISQTGCRTLETLSICQGTTSCNDLDRSVVISVTNRLQIGLLGATCHQSEFCILLFPSSILEWMETPYETLDALSPQGAPGLHFLIFKPKPLFPQSMLAPGPHIFDAKLNSADDRFGVFDFFFERKRDDLLRDPEEGTTIHNFFLMFPKAAYQEAVLISQWLRESTANCNIRTSFQPGQWFNFITIDRGAVIIHEDALWTIRSLPKLSDVLHDHDGKIDFFVFSRSENSRKSFLEPCNAGVTCAYNLSQVLPHGMVVLLTPSFLVSQPEQAYNFLKWFWQNFVDRSLKFGPGKLAVAVSSELRSWMSDLARDKSHRGSKSGPPPIGNQTTKESVVQARLKFCNLLQIIAGETEDDKGGPLIYAPDVLDGNDEQSLVNWFGSWTILHIHQFREFLVLGSSHQTEARLSRYILPVQFVTSCTELLSNHIQIATRRSQPQRPQDASTALTTDMAIKLGDFLTEIDKSNANMNFSPLFLYRFPVTFRNPRFTTRLGDYASHFKDYADWFENFEEPFFSGVIRKRPTDTMPYYKNTYLGLFYTTDNQQSRDCVLSSGFQNCRPWAAIYRPTNIHIRPWKKMELLLWDPYFRYTASDDDEVHREDLLVAQQELISLILERSTNSATILPLDRVWVGPFDDNHDDGFVDPLDCTLSWIGNISTRVKERLPLDGNSLRSRGWRVANVRTSSCGVATQKALKATSESLYIDERHRAIRTVYPAPRSTKVIGASLACNNLLQEAMAKRQGSGEIRFVFQSTLKWYAKHLKVGRGLQHIKVSTWQAVFARYKIHDPEEEC